MKINMTYAERIAFSHRLCCVMGARRMSGNELARLLGVSPAFVAYLRSAERNPPPARLPDLARVLGVTVEWLLDPSRPELTPA